ncbi:GHKL domain-containing protein [Romboutsia ilealis]|uniref:histidine kinase n=1 Tax=Romboutsia faecis TaxID=2764597 RepID=A0ABR7JPG1_9FIRM|nr:ATP-binding protein [Romboutsia faecis]MBC5996794.1 GHKL domain-containing protein [Romboutsia faecis]MRN24750.1 GHKL domain-containing protein [Romboutsia ilealis]
MNFFIDLLNTVIQVSIMTYLPYYFLIANKDIDDKDGKKSLVISSISIFVTSVLATNIFKNSNMTSTSITIMSLIIMYIIYMNVYKKALVAYSIAYLLVQIVAILVTSISWPIISNIIYDVELSRLLGIYIPAMILELLVIKSKDSVKVVYDNLTKSKTSLGIVFILVISMDFIASISMMLNGWANVALTNVLILMIVIFIIGISVYMNNMDKKYEEINRLNDLLIDKNNELKKIKHDYGSQISYINGLYVMKQYDRLGGMLKNIINGNAKVSPCIKYITNRDSIISSVVESLDLKDIHVVVDEEFDSSLIDISEYELHKIVSNILSNAITALEGHGLIIIKTYKIFNSVYISIKNNGPKIDPDILESIFETGFTTKTNEDESHGYGLHIVKEIVENNNGKINVSSNEEYTDFKVIFFNQN